MKLFSGFLLVLAFLAVSACTDKETIEVIKTLCPTTGELLEEGEKCPPPEDTSNNNTSGNQGGSTGGQTDTDTDTDKGAPTRSDCNIDVTVATTEAAPFEGTTGDDTICGNERDDVIDARQGDDTVYGGPGDDTLIGGDDRDVLKGEAGNDTLRGGQGNDTLDGGDGTDTADYSKENLNAEKTAIAEEASAVVVNLAENHARDTYMDDDTLEGIENVKGTSLGDTITGDGKANKLEGFAGEDTIKGGGGNDVIDGGDGNDAMNGGAGNDSIVYSSIDTSDPVDVDGGDGEDTLIVGGDATLGGTGTTGTVGFENLQAEEGTTVINLTGDDKPNKLIGNDANNQLTGGGGKDILTGGKGADCFVVDAGTTVENNNADKEKEIRATSDTITDYEAGEIISIRGVNDLDAEIEVSGGNIRLIIQAVTDTDNNNVVTDGERKPTLVNVKGSGVSELTKAANIKNDSCSSGG